MSIRVDPENTGTHASFDLADFSGQHVLEIGCGDGRVTGRCAGRAVHSMSIDPFSLLGELMGDPEKFKRVTAAMLKMQKIIVADLQKADDG
jgi:hypothetical protein